MSLAYAMMVSVACAVTEDPVMFMVCTATGGHVEVLDSCLMEEGHWLIKKLAWPILLVRT